MSEELFVKLRDCFTAGYTLPQYCIDNGIKKPLFVSEEKYKLFLWQVYIQFDCDRRLQPQFCFIDNDAIYINLHANRGFVKVLKIDNFSTMNLDVFDKVILLTKETIKADNKNIVSLADLEKFFIQRTYVEIPLLNFLQRYPGVKLFLTNTPDIYCYEGGSTFNSQLCGVGEFIERLRKDNSGNVKTTLDKFGYTNEQVFEISSIPLVKKNNDGSTVYIDDNTKSLLGIKNGKRVTAYQPEKFLNRIYFVGECIYFEIYAPFDKTIESYLQKILKKNNLPYRVENNSQAYWGRFHDYFYNLNKLNPAPGDIIFAVVGHFHANDVNIIPFFDVSNAFASPHDYKELFCVKGHINELGYKILAEKYFEFLTENNFFRDTCFNYPTPPPPLYHRYGIPPQFEGGGIKNIVNEELEKYKQQLKTHRDQIGSLVMNCNPFTLGHQYLAEYAAAQVAKLYIFVVEEDKSEFLFADRIELVKQGVKHIPNVEVLPSGKFIISQQTFSGYFNKAELQDVQVDSSEDVEIFGREIAPTLGITVRFAGEEPTDNVTRQYNETMKKILPQYGVEFCEIPRKIFGDEPISASKVREALHAGDFDKIKNLVPETTFKYLCERNAELRRHFTALIGIKMRSAKQEDVQIVSVSDDKAEINNDARIEPPNIGCKIEAYLGKLEFGIKSAVKGRIHLRFSGADFIDMEDNSKRVPCRIDYTKLTVNGEVIFDSPKFTWYYKPYIHRINAKAGDEIKIQVEWLPHRSYT